MDQQIVEQLGIGFLCLVGAITAWLLPYRWNPFKLKRLVGQFLSPEINQIVPKVIGSLLAVGGFAILVATAVIGKFK